MPTAATDTDSRLALAIRTLHSQGCSLVAVAADGTVTTGHLRGVADLWRMLSAPSEPLRGAVVADKVVGKGAAAIMAAAGVAALHADVISRPALQLLAAEGIPAAYTHAVPGIINRAGTGPCPVEALCAEATTPAHCLPLIHQFLQSISTPKQ